MTCYVGQRPPSISLTVVPASPSGRTTARPPARRSATSTSTSPVRCPTAARTSVEFPSSTLRAPRPSLRASGTRIPASLADVQLCPTLAAERQCQDYPPRTCSRRAVGNQFWWWSDRSSWLARFLSCGHQTQAEMDLNLLRTERPTCSKQSSSQELCRSWSQRAWSR